MIERTGPSLGIDFSDTLLHGWDVAKATGQDTTMPEGLAAAAYEIIHGAFTDDQRKGVFKPEVEVGDDASPQDRSSRTPVASPADRADVVRCLDSAQFLRREEVAPHGHARGRHRP